VQPVIDQFRRIGEERTPVTKEEQKKLLEIWLPRTNKYHPYLYSLVDLNWKIFGSLTWSLDSRRKASEFAQRKRESDFKRLIQLTSKQFKVKPCQFNYYHALEFGNAEECHLHFLIENTGLRNICPDSLSTYMQDFWKNQFRLENDGRSGAGEAIILPFDKTKQFEGVSYLLKREYDDFGQERERWDTISDNLWLLLNKKQ
jgi:hypothetical protein